MVSIAPTHATMTTAGLQDLIDLLRLRGFEVVGPRIRDEAIVYDELDQVSQLPIGWTDQHDAGTYQLLKREDEAVFGYNLGPDSWKKYLHPPRLRLWAAHRDGNGVKILDEIIEQPRFAFFGVRSCELRAIAIQDKVFLGSEHRDEDYAARREQALIIAVNCTQASGTCFCVSMASGPAVQTGYDLALTEILNNGTHRFLVTAGTESGREILDQLDCEPATPLEHQAADAAIDQARQQMGRTMQTSGLREDLLANLDHPHWDDVAARCLSCANCTMVCPTCFCTTVADSSDLTGDHAERWRRWDSCFTSDFSYVHGGSIRPSAKSRYRQWLTHKLAHWIDQFDTSGCVGCGRCISWCPVGIDITEEVKAIRQETVPLSNQPPTPSDVH